MHLLFYMFLHHNPLSKKRATYLPTVFQQHHPAEYHIHKQRNAQLPVLGDARFQVNNVYSPNAHKNNAPP